MLNSVQTPTLGGKFSVLSRSFLLVFATSTTSRSHSRPYQHLITCCASAARYRKSHIRQHTACCLETSVHDQPIRSPREGSRLRHVLNLHSQHFMRAESGPRVRLSPLPNPCNECCSANLMLLACVASSRYYYLLHAPPW